MSFREQQDRAKRLDEGMKLGLTGEALTHFITTGEKPAGKDNSDAEAKPTEETTPVADDSAQDASSEAESSQEEASSGESGQSAHQPTPPTTVDTGLEQQLRTVQQQYRTLQGLYQSMQRRVDEAERARNDALNRLQQLEQQRVTSPQASTGNIDIGLSDEELSQWDEDSIKLMQRVASSVSAPLQRKIEELQSIIAQTSQQLSNLPNIQQTQQTMQYNNFLQAVEARVNSMGVSFNEINIDNNFHKWLDTPPPGMYITRRVELDAARNTLDVDRAVNVFSAYVREADPARRTGIPSATAGRGFKNLDSQVVPDKKRSAPLSDNAKKSLEQIKAEMSALQSRISSSGNTEQTRKQLAILEKQFIQAVNDAKKGYLPSV